MTALQSHGLLERYRNGEAGADELRKLEDLLEADPQLRRRLVKDVLQDLCLYRVLGETASGTDRSAQDRRSTRLPPQVQPVGARSIIYACAAAAALLITTGLAALWLSPESVERPLSQSERRHHRIIVEQLRELNLEREAIETAKRRPRPKPAPGIPPPDEPAQTRAQQETEEAARFIEARRSFVMRQLRSFQSRRALPDDLDEEVFDPRSPSPVVEPAVVETGPVGRVLLAEGEAGVLIRAAEGGAQRLALTEGLALQRGDCIETSRNAKLPPASVQLKGGATIDIDRATSIELLGRDNLRFRGGRIYAHIAVPYPEDAYPEAGQPFSLQTEAGRFLTHNMEAELSLSTSKVMDRDLRARVDSGKVHLVNHKGHVMGRKGQELRSRRNRKPSSRQGFSVPIWRGRERFFRGLPFGRSSPIVLSSYKSGINFGEHYAMAMALRGEIQLVGLQSTRGRPDQINGFHQLTRDAQQLRRHYGSKIPTITLGAQNPLRPSPSGKLSEANVERSDAARQIVYEARKAKPSKPLVVLCHGTVTDVAAAWLIDRSMMDRVVVVLTVTPGKTDWMWYVEDPTAGEIVMRHFRCVIVRGEDLKLGEERVARIRDSRWSFMRDRQINGRKFRGLYYITNPSPSIKVKRSRFTGFDKAVKLQPDPNGNVWEIRGQHPERVLMREFDRIFLEAIP